MLLLVYLIKIDLAKPKSGALFYCWSLFFFSLKVIQTTKGKKRKEKKEKKLDLPHGFDSSRPISRGSL